MSLFKDLVKGYMVKVRCQVKNVTTIYISQVGERLLLGRNSAYLLKVKSVAYGVFILYVLLARLDSFSLNNLILITFTTYTLINNNIIF